MVCLFVNSVDQEPHNDCLENSQQVDPTSAGTQRFRHVVSPDKPGPVRLEASSHHLFCLNLFSELSGVSGGGQDKGLFF